MTGRIILLNGSSSAGKTTLARAIQTLSAAPVQLISLDQYRDGLAPRFRGMNSKASEPGSRGLNVVPAEDGLRTELHFGDVGRRTLKGMRRAVAAMATVGLDVVVDDLILEPEFLGDYLAVLADFRVLFVRVQCDLATVNARESARPGRFPGTAAAHFERVHAGCRYDLQVDTARLSPRQCAERVLAAIESPPVPSAFELLRADA